MNHPATPLIGFGQVRHRRVRPVAHTFCYPSYFLLLPMRQWRSTSGGPLARNRWSWISFHDSDHGLGGEDALSWMESLLAREGVEDIDGEIWLQTFPRVLGHTFKPVSFWYAHRANGALAAIVAEVNNTFGERHAYLLSGPQLQWGREQHARKVFHVSPFCSTRGEYRFRFWRGPAHGAQQRTLARVDLHDEQGALLQTSLSGQLHPLSHAALHRAFWGTPLMTLGVVARIHWQALRLWLKRVPFFSKPAAPERFVTR